MAEVKSVEALIDTLARGGDVSIIIRGPELGNVRRKFAAMHRRIDRIKADRASSMSRGEAEKAAGEVGPPDPAP